jgi:hypothetical protein
MVSQEVSERYATAEGWAPPGPSFKSFPTTWPLALALDQASTRAQEAVGGGQTEMGPRPVGMGGVTTGARFAERIELGLFTLRRWEKCACSLLLPHHLQADIALNSPASFQRRPHRCWTSKRNIPTPINRASRIPTTNEITQCRLGLTSFDPAPFCAPLRYPTRREGCP